MCFKKNKSEKRISCYTFLEDISNNKRSEVSAVQIITTGPKNIIPSKTLHTLLIQRRKSCCMYQHNIQAHIQRTQYTRKPMSSRLNKAYNAFRFSEGNSTRCSIHLATSSRRRSLNDDPNSCRPMGRPRLDVCTGSTNAGIPVMQCHVRHYLVTNVHHKCTTCMHTYISIHQPFDKKQLRSKNFICNIIKKKDWKILNQDVHEHLSPTRVQTNSTRYHQNYSTWY